MKMTYEEICKRVQKMDREELKGLVAMAWEFHEEEPEEGREDAYNAFVRKVEDLGLEWDGEATDLTCELATARFGLCSRYIHDAGAWFVTSMRGNRYLSVETDRKGVYRVADIETLEVIGEYEECTPPEEEQVIAGLIEAHEDPEGFAPEDFRIF